MTPAEFRWAAWNHYQRQGIERIVGDPYWKFESPAFRDVIRIVVAALIYGPNADRIAKGLGLNRDKVVRPAAKFLRSNGLWTREGVVAPWAAEGHPDPALEITMHALCAKGLACYTDDPSIPSPGYEDSGGHAHP
jgi:hypothetical protein